MEDVLLLLFFTPLFDILFWGIAYFTGYFVISVVSLGKWIPGPLLRNDSNKIKWKDQTGIATFQRDGKTYLGGIGVALIGLAFWVIIILLLVLL